MKYIVDRVEENFIVCEDENGKIINIEKHKEADNVKEGDVISIKDNKIFIDITETKKLKMEVEKLTKDLWQ